MTPIYIKWLDRFNKACATFAWTVKSMESNKRENIDEYIKQVEYMERTLHEIKRALLYFKNTGGNLPPGGNGNPGGGMA